MFQFSRINNYFEEVSPTHRYVLQWGFDCWDYFDLDVAKKARKFSVFTVKLIGKLDKTNNKHLKKKSKQSVQR
jgi:hypothetical protein